MKHPFSFSPAHALKPCVRAHAGSVIFSAVFPKAGEHGLQLIHAVDGETFYIPLTGEYRVGRVYSVKISPLDPDQWLYRYRSEGSWVLDPHARGIRRMGLKSEEDADACGTVTACICPSPEKEPLLPEGPERPLPPADWTKEVLYSLHVKGFTAAKPESFPGRGTFAGVEAMIPYLRDLGVTAVEIMPVYLPLPDQRAKKPFRTMQEALRAWPVGPQGDPMRDMKDRPNYWGFGRGLYYALRPEYGTPEMFARMVRSFHRAGIRVLLQIYFEKGIQPDQQTDLLHFYVDRYGIDGFRLLGHLRSIEAISSAPSLADTTILHRDFPFESMREAAEAEEALLGDDLESLLPEAAAEREEASGPDREKVFFRGPAAPVISARGRAPAPQPVCFPQLIACPEDPQTLLRRFVKSDDYVLKDFLKTFLNAPEDHGELRTVTSYEGFTLADLVSYSERHNEANGELGLDGRADNYSWNCGEEGETDDEGILTLRRRQIRNFLTLLLLSKGTPMLRQGDERFNSQKGNNNPYCQDNEISWIDWDRTQEADRLTAFTSKLIAFRMDNPVFYKNTPFHYMDTLGIGHPDVSLHGEEAWKPDLGSFSHSIGIAYCENYTEADPVRARKRTPSFVYLAVNMYWKELSLALPKLPAHCIWKGYLDTSSEEGFLDRPVLPEDQHFVRVPARSIRILRSVPDIDAIVREKKQELWEDRPCAGTLLHCRQKKMHSGCAGPRHRICGRSAHAVRRLRKLYRF